MKKSIVGGLLGVVSSIVIACSGGGDGEKSATVSAAVTPGKAPSGSGEPGTGGAACSATIANVRTIGARYAKEHRAEDAAMLEDIFASGPLRFDRAEGMVVFKEEIDLDPAEVLASAKLASTESAAQIQARAHAALRSIVCGAAAGGGGVSEATITAFATAAFTMPIQNPDKPQTGATRTTTTTTDAGAKDAAPEAAAPSDAGLLVDPLLRGFCCDKYYDISAFGTTFASLSESDHEFMCKYLGKGAKALGRLGTTDESDEFSLPRIQSGRSRIRGNLSDMTIDVVLGRRIDICGDAFGITPYVQVDDLGFDRGGDWNVGVFIGGTITFGGRRR